MVFAPGLKRAETPMEVMARLATPVESGCWEWHGPINEKGYARVQYFVGRKRITRRASHVAYELANAVEVPDDLEIDHTCRNRACVNPEHLEPITHLENILRAREHHLATRLFCEKHPDVLLKYEGRVRVCRICKAAYVREWRAEQREKQGLPPSAPHKGQRKFQCDTCGEPYEILGMHPGRGTPRYGCRKCRQAYYRNRRLS